MLADEDLKMVGLDPETRFSPRPSAVSQVLRAIRDEVEKGPAQREPDLAQAGASCPSFSCAGCTFQIAACIEERRKAWALAYEVYRTKGYAAEDSSGLWYGLHDALFQTVTFLALREGRAVAALTVVFDSPLGLPADEVFGVDLKALRERGRRPCELVSLVSIETDLRLGTEIVKHLFKLAYLTAHRIERATDFIITVNPRHVPFYTHLLQFESCGVERPYGKVGGAPAAPLRLDLETAEARYQARYGHLEGERNLYRFFINACEPEMLEWIRRHRQPLDQASFQRHFQRERPLLDGALHEHRNFIEVQYLACDLAGV